MTGKTADGLALQANGELVTIGHSLTSNNQFDVTRYTANGALDSSFGTGGVATTTFAGGQGVSSSNIAVLPSGKIVASGTVTLSGTPVVELVQLNAGGTADTTFGTSGVMSDTIAGITSANVQMAVAPGGDIVIASSGKAVPGGGANDFDVSRFHDDAAASASLPATAQQAVGYTATSLVVQVSLSAASASSVVVSIATVDGTATAGTDYTATSGALTFAPGTTSQSVTIAILGDLYAEPARSFALNLTGALGATVSGSATTIQLTNNHTPSWTNPVNALDVNGDGSVTPIDALAIINRLNSLGQGSLGAAPTGTHSFYDADGDGSCTPIDALRVINYLNAHAAVASPQAAAPQAAAPQAAAPQAAAPQAAAPQAAAPQVVSAADAVTSELSVTATDTGAGAENSSATGPATSNSTAVTLSTAAGPAANLADVAFTLAAGSSVAPPSASGGVWAPANSPDAAASPAAAATPAALAAAATSDLTGAASGTDDWSRKTDVEDLLDLLV